MAFIWVYENEEGTEIGRSEPFDERSEADEWIGVEFATLLDDGVEQVKLLEDGTEVFGPMSLNP